MIKCWFETLGGAVLASLPFWIHALHAIGEAAVWVSAVCGAIIGLHGVWRIWKRWRSGGHW